MMFRAIITQIQGAWCPIDVELFLVYTILDPIKAHVHCLGTFEFDSFVDYPCGCGIISLEWRGRLWMIEFKECLADWHGLLAVDEKGAGFISWFLVSPLVKFSFSFLGFLHLT
jgi:hypothetical protein